MMVIDMGLFATLFIIQYVGHRIGDFFLQTDTQAQQKTVNQWARFRHCFVYAVTIAAMTLLVLPWEVALYVYALTVLEHYLIDDRKFVIWWKTFLETKIARNKKFDIKNVPSFVIIEIDQTIHYVRILAISYIFAGLL